MCWMMEREDFPNTSENTSGFGVPSHFCSAQGAHGLRPDLLDAGGTGLIGVAVAPLEADRQKIGLLYQFWEPIVAGVALIFQDALDHMLVPSWGVLICEHTLKNFML